MKNIKYLLYIPIFISILVLVHEVSSVGGYAPSLLAIAIISLSLYLIQVSRKKR